MEKNLSGHQHGLLPLNIPTRQLNDLQCQLHMLNADQGCGCRYAPIIHLNRKVNSKFMSKRFHWPPQPSNNRDRQFATIRHYHELIKEWNIQLIRYQESQKLRHVQMQFNLKKLKLILKLKSSHEVALIYQLLCHRKVIQLGRHSL